MVEEWDHEIEDRDKLMKISFDFDYTLMFPSGDDSLIGKPNTEFVNKFKRHMVSGDEVYIVTSRNENVSSRNQITKFCQKNGLRPKKIIATNGKIKAPTLQELGIELHYDDDPQEMSEAGAIGIQTVDAMNDAAKRAFNEYYGLDESQSFKQFFRYIDNANNSVLNEIDNQRIKVYLDDIRPTPEGWVRVYWPEEAIELLKTGNVEEISLDHDLGDDAHGTGNDVVNWIEEQVFLHGFNPPMIHVHSDNAAGVRKMKSGIEQIEKYKKRNLGLNENVLKEKKTFKQFSRYNDDNFIRPIALVDEDNTKIPKNIWFHGDPNQRKHFCDQRMDREAFVQDPNANGPGIYFTKDYTQARGYAYPDGYVYTVKINPNAGFIIKEKDKAKDHKDFLFTLIKKAQEHNPETVYYAVTDYGHEIMNVDDVTDDHIKSIIENYLSNFNLISAAVSVYKEFFGREANPWTKAMKETGALGFLQKQPDTDHLIVYDCDAIEILKEEKYVQDLNEKKTFKSFFESVELKEKRGIDLEIPKGTVLYHGTGEQFDKSKVLPGGYDRLFWTTDSKDVARSYIPSAGGFLHTSTDHITTPTKDSHTQNVQKKLGIDYDYDNVEFDNSGRAKSYFPAPIFADIEEKSRKLFRRLYELDKQMNKYREIFKNDEYEEKYTDEEIDKLFKEYETVEEEYIKAKEENNNFYKEKMKNDIVNKKLKELGYEPEGGSSYNGDYRWKLRFSNGELMPNDYRFKGRLLIVKLKKDMKIYDITLGGEREADLMDLDYHDLETFNKVEKEGYDGVKITDFAQTERYGNLMHTSIGFFKHAIPDLDIDEVEAEHPDKIEGMLFESKNKKVRVGVVGYSDDKFDKEKAKELVKKAFDKIEDEYGNNITIVSGYTALGISLLAYKEAVRRKWKTKGIACKKADEFEKFPVDSYEIVGDEWGDESETFLNDIDVLVKIGGGDQSKEEAKEAKKDGLKVFRYNLEEK